MENRYGKLSELNMEVSRKDDKTVLSDVYFTPPFKIMKPFYENNLMRILQMSASPGIMEGDCQQINIDVKKGSCAEIYSQSFEKIHKMENNEAVRSININIGENCFFIYNPLPTIPYKDSAFNNSITIKLKDNSSVFVYSDILTSGRVAMGESFEYRYYYSLVKIFEGSKLSYMDNTRYNPSEMNMKGIGFYEEYTHLMNMVICNIDIIDEIYKIIEDYAMPWGISENDNGYIIVKALGRSAQELIKISDDIKRSSYSKHENELKK